MKISLKTKIAFLWWRKFQSKIPQNELYSISKTGKGFTSSVIILPWNYRFLPMAQYFIKSLVAKKEKKIIKKIIGWEQHKLVFDSDFSQKIEFIAEDSFNKFGLLSEASLKKIAKVKYNCAINLDPQVNPISYQLLSCFNSIPRIGFETDFDENIYNIIIARKDKTNYIEQGYEYILNML